MVPRDIRLWETDNLARQTDWERHLDATVSRSHRELRRHHRRVVVETVQLPRRIKMQIFFSFRRNNNNRLDDVLSEKGVGFGHARIRHDQDASERRDSSCRIGGLAGEFGFVVRLHADVSDRQRVMAVAFD